jgi:Smg protein
LVGHYSKDEQERLGVDGLTLIIRLVNSGVLDLNSREMVIDRVLALDSHDVNIDHIKWVVLMVLSNQPGYEEIAEWAESIVGDGSVPLIH